MTETILQEAGLAGTQYATLAGTRTMKSGGTPFTGSSPVDDSAFPELLLTDAPGYDAVLAAAEQAYHAWRAVPAPVRAALAGAIARALEADQEPLARLITLETGKLLREARAEVGAAAEHCRRAGSLAPQLKVRLLPAADPARLTAPDGKEALLYEAYHPLGPTAVITAANYPVLLWAWSAVTAAVCGNSVIWKPSPRALRSALAVQQLAARTAAAADAPEGLFSLISDSDGTLARCMADDPRIPLVSFTGSPASGREIGGRVTARMGRSLLELGGSNAAVITPGADLPAAVEACFTSAILTAGQRCTSLRRLIVHESLHERVLATLREKYAGLVVGNPFAEATTCGPLQGKPAAERFRAGLKTAAAQDALLIAGGHFLAAEHAGSPWYAYPALLDTPPTAPLLQEEWFAPLLFVLPYRGTLEKAIRLIDDTPCGLVASLFSHDPAEAELFLSAAGPRVGMAHVNLGTAGADLALPFGGEKASGHGRVSGSDSWKHFMRQTAGGMG